VVEFKNSSKPVREIARMLNVEAVVEGSIVRSGDRVRISTRLVDGDTDKSIWSATYDRDVRDVLELQNEVADAIAREIQATVAQPESPSIAAHSPVPPDAYEHYLKARFYLNKPAKSRADMEETVRLFELAIARGSTFAPSHAGLAATYQALGTTGTGGLPGVETIPKVRASAERALELDPHLSEAHVILAGALAQAWQWADAEAAYRRAIDNDINDAAALAGYAALLTWQGRTSEGVSMARRARELDPLNVDRTTGLAWILYHARQHDEAIRELKTVLAVQPDHAQALWFLGFALIEASRYDEAIEVLEHDVALRDRNPATLGVLTRAYWRAGRRADALRTVAELEQRERVGYVAPAVFVNAYAGVGDLGRLFSALERAYREHSNIMQFLKTHPVFDDVRDDPRFDELLRRVGLS
jgi:tetratricopeptide (TPR) repeat protein